MIAEGDENISVLYFNKYFGYQCSTMECTKEFYSQYLGQNKALVCTY